MREGCQSGLLRCLGAAWMSFECGAIARQLKLASICKCPMHDAPPHQRAPSGTPARPRRRRCSRTETLKTVAAKFN